MIIFHYANDTMQSTEIKERLTSLSLAHTLHLSEEPVLKLTEGTTSVEGYSAIMSYLDELDRERKQWYYCHC